jgi:hypothetical protein
MSDVRAGDVGVALGLAELGVAEYLLDDADVDALFEQERCRGVASVVDSGQPDPCLCDEAAPVSPVVARVDRRADGRTEDEIPVLPCLSSGEVLGGLIAAMGAQLGDEWGWQGQDELGLPFPAFTPLRRVNCHPPPVRCGHSRLWLMHPSGHGLLTTGQRWPRVVQSGWQSLRCRCLVHRSGHWRR